MTEETEPSWTLTRLIPFGVVVESKRQGADLRAVSVPVLKGWVDDHRVVVLRGFAPLAGPAMPQFCQRLGELLEWDFGAVNELRVQADARNYLYTNNAVPFHWDGAFAGRIPHYIFFHCETAPPQESRGETLFCDTIRLIKRATPRRREVWRRTVITYTTEKIVHYGGTFTSPMISRHPTSGEETLRFAEPVEDLNPVRLEIKGIPEEARADFLRDMHRRLNDPNVCYRHQWSSGDVLIADNHALLHGRRAFDRPRERHIRRVNIL